MRSVVASLGTDAVPRLRIGIGQASPGEATSHVLSEFAPEERQIVDDLIARAADAALAWAIDGAAVAMNRYNKTLAMRLHPLLSALDRQPAFQAPGRQHSRSHEARDRASCR